VFIPVTFMTGPVGVFYREFGLTMAMSIVLSGVVALTLTPVLCAMLLKPHAEAGERRGITAKVFGAVGDFIGSIAGPVAPLIRLLLAVVLGLAVGAGVLWLLRHSMIVHLMHEKFGMTETGAMI